MWTYVSLTLSIVVLVGGAALVMMARRQDIARVTAERNVEALRGLLSTRDIQLADKARDLDTLEAEHKQLIQVNMKEMVSGWYKFQQTLVASENARLRAHIEECGTCTMLVPYAREQPKA